MATLGVAVEGDTAMVKVGGRASFVCGPDFKRVIGALQERGWRKFIFDLSECTLMDSTFLGIMAGFGMRVEEAKGEKAILLNASAHVMDLLDNLGVAHLFETRQGAPPLSAPCVPVTASAALDKVEAARTSLDAHQTLIDINPANAARFKDVARFLAEDLKKLEQPPAKG